MAEYRFFDEGTLPAVSTFEFHRDRGRAQHLEQPNHKDRLNQAFEFIGEAYSDLGPGQVTLSDLGCGDGGLLSRIDTWPDMHAWGYDFTPANVAGALLRGVDVAHADVFGDDRDWVNVGLISVMTEVLEHLADPHEVLRWLHGKSRYLVASSPWDETPESHDECHAWGWDYDGYTDLIQDAGWRILHHVRLRYKFQVVLVRST